MSAGHSSLRRLGLVAAAGTFVLDQATKLWLLNAVQIEDTGPWSFGPFFDFIAVWNRGISYGLFQQYSDLGRWLLIAASVAASLWLAALLWRTQDRLSAAALGLLIGGALGNALDRFVYGAVFDFAHFHVGRFSWYVFNVADVAIVVGVALLLYENVFPRRGKGPEQSG